MPADFIHLHVHSEFSLVDSTIRIDRLVAACAQAGMPAVALTDQVNLFALVKFYTAAEKAGIKPIAGCDIWIADPADRGKPHRLTLLCQDLEGYRNLSRLVSRAWAEGRHGDFALIEADWLFAANRGLIVLAGRESDVGAMLLGGREELARARMGEWMRHFPDRYYFELVRTQRADEEAFIAAAVDLAIDLDLPAIASNDVRFLDREDFEAHEARVCIHEGRVLADPKRPRPYSAEQYLKSPAQMIELFADLPQAIENTVELARRCNLELSFGTYYLPEFPIPHGFTLDSWTRTQARNGLAARLARQSPAAGFSVEDYQSRLETEVDVIVAMGFPGYFLIVADFINWAKDHDIPVGPGRGSGAGSVVAWALGITDIDPLRYGLLFERFLNPERVSMPDFDIDFCMDKRDQVIDYVAAKYGRDHVSQIITFGTMAAKAVLRDCGRVLGMPYGQVDRIAKLIPMRPLDMSLEDALGRSEKSRKEPERIVAEFRSEYESEDAVRELVDLALKLENLTRNAGKHAGGVVIAPGPLTDYAPVYSEAGGEGAVTQFDKDDVEKVGLVKFDFLGLRTLTIIDWAVKAINLKSRDSGLAMTSRSAVENGDSEKAATGGLDISTIPLDDPAVFALFKRAQTVAIFQFESRGMQRALNDARPDRFEDLIALGALYRPGPMDLIPNFCARKLGREPIEYPDPRVEPILKETYGIMVYQEQVMQMAQIVGGYTFGAADLLRRAMGKKKVEEMAKHRAIFREGAARNGVNEAKADAVFDLMEKFAGYGFNKSHAAAYALVSYQTAWLKTHYPAEFMAAVLSADMDNTDKVVNLLGEARALGLTVMPPDINASGHKFHALDADKAAAASKTIRYGLGALKGVGEGAIENVVHARERGGAFRDLADFCTRVDAQKVNKRTLEALIQSGSMDALAVNRASLMAQLPEAMRAAEQQARNAQAGQNDMFGAASPAAVSIKLVEVEDWPAAQRLAGERDTLGHYLSGHPTDAWRELFARVVTCPIGELEKHHKPQEGRSRFGGGQSFTLAGAVLGLRKQGDSRAFVQVEDWSGRFEAVLYREAWSDYAALLSRDAILVFEGSLSIDDFSGNYQLRTQRVSTIESACESRARVLRLRVNGIGGDFATRLYAVLETCRGGSTTVRIAFSNSSGRGEIELGPEWTVRASPALARTLAALDGVLDAEFVYGA
ncbi:MAG: DNA polymerase III subunit alpha [Dokdonella sp.]|uniref:DNA polymerase III subunit alpha n=1 Tax=Dokdonella sp. TaxID=2291710 RepID=UPI002C980C89|nr:DNA polymerase III subunit alpha [Xanthomonadales bacterium]HQW76531.1 DNA polymerase III subunit alpha [Dokdonella sp.]MBK7209496.1 DNA polymerase III subunit alpha [Xanthomonadales bacterium]MBL0223295.1 DNA polymerase III subunit alpha [Xanthomonadales bacterium]HQX66192.1 DNA polymerase III subunit alpha [Dokdonella sp.]